MDIAMEGLSDWEKVCIWEDDEAVSAAISSIVNKWPLEELEDNESEASAKCWKELRSLKDKLATVVKVDGYAYLVTNFHD